MALFSSNVQSLHSGLDGAALRQETIADNIANVDTPNFKARKAHFQHTLNEAEQRFDAYKTSGRHVDFGGEPRGAYTSVDRNRMYDHNGNSVDLDKEMAAMANNQIYQAALVDRMDGQFSSLKTALGGGN
ncbi:flagellar basal body rod protein FlgB [Natribacillus halophilus]|uniref:Flagellar basal body rod protein FlgB n=1 Tax=Natribacillus halophilus TaxID=549003 RepID=A0A1G8PMF8_9BACI|nr:flagellar basal body rod protein FlgB [Natribacillus halophilus]SDI93673.1 flagellar basal-body rod protein FlgB [Natribacillus halophilus]